MVKCLNIGKISVNRYIGRSLVKTPTSPTGATVFYSRVARHLVGSAKNSAVMTVMTLTPRLASHYRGYAVIVTALCVHQKGNVTLHYGMS